LGLVHSHTKGTESFIAAACSIAVSFAPGSFTICTMACIRGRGRVGVGVGV
jgi:hypothetical protein